MGMVIVLLIIIIGYSHYGGFKSLKKLFFKKYVFVNSSSGLNINFYNYFLETAVKMIILSLTEEQIQKNWAAFWRSTKFVKANILKQLYWIKS